MRVDANAKINLTLDVVKRRDDGYHEMDMIMIPLELHDVLTISKHDHNELCCDDMDMPLDASNTIIKAIQLMQKEFSFTQCFKVEVEKHIPMQAGLAGGSADAAALLRGINELMQLQVSSAQLASLGKQIGADVPFCVENKHAIVKGIGEKLEFFNLSCDFHILLVKPQAGVSTKEAFQTLDFEKAMHPATLICKEALQQGDFDRFCSYTGNTLEQSAFQLVPEIAVVKQQLTAYGFPLVLMSGSGSTLFALGKDEEQMQRAYQELSLKYPFVHITKPKR